MKKKRQVSLNYTKAKKKSGNNKNLKARTFTNTYFWNMHQNNKGGGQVKGHTRSIELNILKLGNEYTEVCDTVFCICVEFFHPKNVGFKKTIHYVQ